MPTNTADYLGKASGGGAPSYFNTKEKFHTDLAGGNLALGATDINKTHLLYSSVPGKTVTMMDCTLAGVAVGKAVGFRVRPDSQPIKVINPGVAGTDAILECMLLPGADATLFCNSVANAVGNWRAGGGSRGMFAGPVPVTLPAIQEAGIDLGSAALYASMHGVSLSQGTLQPNAFFTRMSATLYLATFVPNAGTSVVTYAISYNHATDTWSWGTPVTTFTSANQWLHPRVCALSATTFVIASWEATNAKVSARACTVSGNTITQGVTILSGAWGVNPSSASMMRNGGMIADSPTTCFLYGAYNGNILGVLHFSVSGTTLAQDGGAVFASGTDINGPLGGYSPSANNLEVAINGAATTFAIGRYNYAAASVTNTWNRIFKGGQGGYYLTCSDPTNRAYWHSNSNTWVTRSVLNAGLTDISDSQTVYSPIIAGVIDSGALDLGTGWLPLSDTEFLAMTTTVSQFTLGTLTLFNPTTAMRARPNFPKTTSYTLLPSGAITPTGMLFGPEVHGQTNYMLAGNANTTNRRFALLFSNAGQSVVSGRGWYVCMFDLPRNYDQQ